MCAIADYHRHTKLLGSCAQILRSLHVEKLDKLLFEMPYCSTTIEDAYITCITYIVCIVIKLTLKMILVGVKQF